LNYEMQVASGCHVLQHLVPAQLQQQASHAPPPAASQLSAACV